MANQVLPCSGEFSTHKMHIVADSAHIKMDSSTLQQTLQDACTMYYAHSGGFSPLENGLFNSTAYTARCMYYMYYVHHRENTCTYREIRTPWHNRKWDYHMGSVCNEYH